MYKRLFSTLLALSLTLTAVCSFGLAPAASAAAPRTVIGDINADNAVTTYDALLLYAYTSGQTATTPERLQADVTRDSKVDLADALHLFSATNGAKPLFTPSPDELALLELVNKEREAAGLNSLTFHTDYLPCAILRAQEQFVAEGHTRPDGTNFRTVFEDFGFAYNSQTGENLALFPHTVERAMEMWMGSSGHRANILYPTYTSVAIGIVRDKGGYGMFCQIFVI